MLQDKLRMKYLRGVKKIFAALAAFGKLSSLIMFPSLEVTRRTFARKDMFLLFDFGLDKRWYCRGDDDGDDDGGESNIMR